jgi:predicted transcriptional regulator
MEENITTIRSMKYRTHLGPLQREVMQCLWNERETKVRSVYDCIRKKRPIAYTTVLTVMTRLYRQGLLNREKQGRVFLYSPLVSKGELARSILRETLRSLTQRFGIDAVAAFVQEIEDLPETKRRKLLKKLSRKQ